MDKNNTVDELRSLETMFSRMDVPETKIGDWAKAIVKIENVLQFVSEIPEIVFCGSCQFREDHHYESKGEPPYIKSSCGCKWGLKQGYQVHAWDFCSRGKPGQGVDIGLPEDSDDD